MPRKVKSRNLDSREGRGKLEPRGMPYYRSLDKKLHLGYRRIKGNAGTWWARHYLGDQKYEVEPIGIADDQSEADGIEIFDFWQAQDRARALMGARVINPNKRGPYTVNDALDAYFKKLEAEGRSKDAISDAKGRAGSLIRPSLGDKKVDGLTLDDLQDWRDGIAKARPRVRAKPGDEPRYREQATDLTEEQLEDAARARRSSANRLWTILRAALNLAFKKKKAINTEWRGVEPFRGVDKARIRYLEVAEARRLVNATDPQFRPVVEAALLTGARYGQIARLVVGDYNRDAGTVRMSSRKGDGTVKVYHVHLTDEGVRSFNRAVAGRKGLIFTKADGSPWKKSEQDRRIEAASEQAKIEPPAHFHILRHTYASHAVMKGAPLLVVAQNLGHSDTRMVEKHYGHLAPSYKAAMIRKTAPKFGFKIDSKVETLRGA